MENKEYTELPEFEELDDDLIDLACSTGALYRVDFRRAWEVVREGLRASRGQAPAVAQPFGWVKQSEIDSSKAFGGSINLWRIKYDCDVPVYLTALTAQPAPKENTNYKILWDYIEENLVYADFKDGGYINYIGWPDKDRRETLKEEILLKALL
jgi:hypothetical protein